ncbi:sugar phosphate isomerase/epimerase family protein [Aeromicrobium ginsengisoli]|uniref:Sugar phosphate isomerase/epimerase n=1 Tax=Aeromicrobium ginsengisoli TaxID=363867 RepID=A0A5M4FAJ8_9ACTN|nr:TIM barrel protein [Aeromicrobium ginsengisoli]KAA1394269.1 sugar phosphate isomerase/epimerase [Aeromicrobium ginsengisoli]
MTDPTPPPQRWPLGVCRLAWTSDAATASVAAQRLGFDHLDLVGDDDPEGLALPVGIRMGPGPGRGWAWPAPAPHRDWDEMVARLRTVDEPRVEPWAGSLLGSDAAIHRLLDEVPGVRLVVDTGHVTQWGGDVLAFLPHADHVQLRQAALGVGQLPAAQGEVDVRGVLGALDSLDYSGLLSIEYFDLPHMGWPLDDPPRHAAELAEVVRPMLADLAAGREATA